MKKYLPHIRIPFKLFDDERIKKIPEEHRSSSLLILIALLKFVNSNSGQCYPRQATISSMVCLSRSTIYRCTELLQEVGILKKKRLKSTLLYMINPEYIVNKKIDVSSKDYDVSRKHIPRSMMTDIKRTTLRTTNFVTVNDFAGDSVGIIDRFYPTIIDLITPNSFTFDDSSNTAGPDMSMTYETTENDMFTRYLADITESSI